ncbi:pseudouridine synthase [Flavivirga rizhaonensis]|uniref:Pseudouridine synthase n=1 Tax=Flavivirga rizhaonensis TaxID=2559571 RepID=A0A4S1E1L8_9FLAO|nr:pseudouridine synthase [Flavivirga rizhaonensis]TGV04487.1 pseudouridine synthase [Flavivirga rizhaonensis]
MEVSKSEHRHFVIYKPYGYLSQFKSHDSKQQSKKFLGGLHGFPEGIMAIGRLDEKSEGLLLLTTDGKMSDFVNSQKVEKEYYAQVDGIITDEAINLLRAGVEIGFDGKKYQTRPCKASKLNEIPDLPKRSQKIRDDKHGPTSWVSITLNEGKFRQVRKMTSAVGFPTLRLVRVRVGDILINTMQTGEVVEVDQLLL